MFPWQPKLSFNEAVIQQGTETERQYGHWHLRILAPCNVCMCVYVCVCVRVCVCVFVGGKQHVINQIVNQSTKQDSLKFLLQGCYV